MNLVPPAIFVLGLGVLSLGFAPQAVSFVTYGFVAWSFLLELIGGIIGLNHWLLDTSLFHQISAAPAANPNWAANAVIVGLGLLGVLAGATRFLRRDLQPA